MGDFFALGDRLSVVRKAAGLSQSEIAEKLDISRSSYQYYERGERDLPASLLLKICNLFDDDAHRILTGQPSDLTIKRIEEISKLLDEYEENLDVSLTSEARARVMVKVLKDGFRTHPSLNPSANVEEIESLFRMLQ